MWSITMNTCSRKPRASQPIFQCISSFLCLDKNQCQRLLHIQGIITNMKCYYYQKKNCKQYTSYELNAKNMSLKLPCHGFHFPSVREGGPLDGFSCQLHEQIQLFGQLNQYLNQLFQQPKIYNLKESRMPFSTRQEILKWVRQTDGEIPQVSSNIINVCLIKPCSNNYPSKFPHSWEIHICWQEWQQLTHTRSIIHDHKNKTTALYIITFNSRENSHEKICDRNYI